MPKPVLSDSLFNAGDVATAVLNEADLQITNENLAVTNISSNFSFQNSYSEWYGFQCYAFMGFVFISFGCAKNYSNVSSGDVIASLDDSDYYPSAGMNLVTVGYQGDLAERIFIGTNGEIQVAGPINAGSDNNFYILVNGWYKYN